MLIMVCYNTHIMKTIRHYNVIFKPEPEGGFTAVVPTLPGCVSFGMNLPHARRMMRDAIDGYIASLKKHKESIPTDYDSVTGFIDVTDAETSRSYTA